MGFLERAIRRGVKDAVGKAVGNAVRQAVEPKATALVNKAAGTIDRAAQTPRPQTVRTDGLESAVLDLERSVQSYATEAAKNRKLCPACGKPTTAEKKFCPECGAKLPEQTLAEGAVCSECGRQNTIGTKFCQDCGAKLPAAVAEERERAERNAAVLSKWNELLVQYPVWSFGGDEISLEQPEENVCVLYVTFQNDPPAARRAVEQYRQLLLSDGFRQAGQYPTVEQLFKRVDGVVCNVDTEHCFEGDPDTASIGFCFREPYGGFDYVKPEPRKKPSFKDLLGL